MSKDYTTGQVAKMMKVCPRTVAKWCDNGMIEHYRVPGSRDRRMTKEALIEFVNANAVPMPKELKDGSSEQRQNVQASKAGNQVSQ